MTITNDSVVGHKDIVVLYDADKQFTVSCEFINSHINNNLVMSRVAKVENKTELNDLLSRWMAGESLCIDTSQEDIGLCVLNLFYIGHDDNFIYFKG